MVAHLILVQIVLVRILEGQLKRTAYSSPFLFKYLNMSKLPFFFWADRLTPVRFYGYPSSTKDRICEIDASDKENYDDVQRFHDFKRKCLETNLDMSKEDEDTDWKKDIWDNKIVIECLTENGSTIFVGFYDFNYSIGLSVQNRDFIEPKRYQILEELAVN